METFSQQKYVAISKTINCAARSRSSCKYLNVKLLKATSVP